MSSVNKESTKQHSRKQPSNVSIMASCNVPVSDQYMGTVIGKGGHKIEQIKKECGVRIRTMKPKPEEGHLFNTFKITGEPGNVSKAEKWIRSIIGNTFKQDHPELFEEKQQTVE